MMIMRGLEMKLIIFDLMKSEVVFKICGLILGNI